MIALVVGYSLVWATAGAAAALLRVRGAVAFLLATAVIGTAEVVAVSHLLSRFDAYDREWFLAVVALLAVWAAMGVVRVRPRRPSLVPRAALRELAGDRLLAVLAAIVALELAYLLALALFTPPTERDALTYHLTRALLWIQRGSIGRIPDATDARLNDFPVNAEALQGSTMLLSGSARWVGLVQLGALLIAVLAIYGIATRIGLRRREAAFGALLFATLPVVALQAPTALNDLTVASLVAMAAFFALGRTRIDVALGCVAVALLVGTKGTGLFALPSLLAIAATTQRGRRLADAVVGGVVAVFVGAAWYGVNLAAGVGAFGTVGKEARGTDEGVLAMAARGTRHAVEAFELPGAHGTDRYVYVVAAAVVGGVFLALRRPRAAVLAAGLTVATLLVLPLERALHSIYWNGWQLVGYDEAVALGTIRDSTVASNVQSWYGPVGLACALAVLAIAPRAVRRNRLPAVATVLVSAPLLFLVATAVAITYFDFNGRFLMGGVALSASTWGLVRSFAPGASALVAVAAATVVLVLVNSEERPAGVDLLEGTNRPSIWTLPREWAQSIQPEVAVLIGYADDHVPAGAPIALARDAYYPFAYAGYPAIRHRLVYADTLAEADGAGADWVVLALTARCERGWERVFRSPPWGIYKRVAGAGCRTP